MAYVKKSAIPFSKMQKLLRGYGYDGASLSRTLGCKSPTTGKRRMDRPWELTLDELGKINRAVAPNGEKIPLDEIREAISV